MYRCTIQEEAIPDRSQVPWYYRSLDFEAVWRDYPPAPGYFQSSYLMSRDALRALQNERFLRQIERAWGVPFYQRHWAKAGIRQGDIRGLDDLARLPAFSVHDMRESIARKPPWGDLIGIDPEHDEPLPLVFQTSGGTTGLPRVMMYAPQDREIMNINTGRRMYMQGVRPFDLVQVALATGLPNAGFLLRESLWKYTGAVPIISGSGNQTPTRRQVELMKGWGVHFFAALGPYLRHVATVARDELKFDVRELKLKGLLSWLGVDDRRPLEEMWGTDVFDNYGTNEFGTVCCDCRHKSGMHIFEDSFVAEIADPETLEPKAEGEKGTLILTTLFKYAAPMIRFNTNDILSFVPGDCPCGSTHRRLSKVFGRADNMVKVRGINVFPEAVGACVAEFTSSNGEFICVVDPAGDGRREEMTVMVETSEPAVAKPEFAAALSRRLHDAFGLTLKVEVVDKGGLGHLTGIEQVMKVRRLLDRRKH
jgi:phenylacetate-CoA ligase